MIFLIGALTLANILLGLIYWKLCKLNLNQPTQQQPIAQSQPIEVGANKPNGYEHEIYNYSEDGNHQLIAKVPHYLGINEDVKAALRDSSKIVHWTHSDKWERGIGV